MRHFFLFVFIQSISFYVVEENENLLNEQEVQSAV